MIPIGTAATSYSKKIDDWADINKNLKIIYTNSEDEQHEQSLSTTNDWKGEYGKINKAMILKYLDNNILNILYLWSSWHAKSYASFATRS